MDAVNPYPLELQMLAQRLGGQSRVAGLLGVNRSCITRWLKRQLPDARNRTRIDGLHYVLTRLQGHYRPETAQKWLVGTNGFLGHQRPIDLIKRDRLCDVLAAIEQEEAGGYV